MLQRSPLEAQRLGTWEFLGAVDHIDTIYQEVPNPRLPEGNRIFSIEHVFLCIL